MSEITLTDYARRIALDPATVRLTADRGGFHSAHKQDGDWMIDETETYPEKRLRMHEALNPGAWRSLNAKERRHELRLQQIRQYSWVGNYGMTRTFTACLQRIPQGLLDTLTPEQAGQVVDLVHDTYQSGQRNPDTEWLLTDD